MVVVGLLGVVGGVERRRKKKKLKGKSSSSSSSSSRESFCQIELNKQTTTTT